MIIKIGLNNLKCLVTIEKLNNRYFYIDNTKGIFKRIFKKDINKYIKNNENEA